LQVQKELIAKSALPYALKSAVPYALESAVPYALELAVHSVLNSPACFVLLPSFVYPLISK
ncbi:MAG: hypothetical protein ACOVO6_00615, partial [Burkholderiaceae bacterium]